MASDVAPGYAWRIRLTTVPAVPKPGDTVVSRAPNTWTWGQEDWRSWIAGTSTGDPLTTSECAQMSRKAVLGVGHIFKMSGVEVGGDRGLEELPTWLVYIVINVLECNTGKV